jgi:ubiquinol-cytochrome c reductase cytochrome c subunit
MSIRKRLWTLGAAGLALLATYRALPARQVGEDDEDRRERLALSRRAMEENCQICHSADLITASRLTAKQWTTEVEKMVGWGSPLPKEQQDPLIDYLSTTYSDTTPPAPLSRMNLADALATIRPESRTSDLPSGDPARGAPLYVSQCANCHGPDARGADLGPNLVAIPALLRPSDYAEVVRKGRHRMPGFGASLKPQEEANILAWLRTRRYPEDDKR